MAVAPELHVTGVELAPMRRRHLRSVMRIEGLVYPRPWSLGLFLQEIGRRGDRVYLVARWKGEVVGYAGLMVVMPEAHITTIAVDPEYQRHRIGQKLMVGMIEAALERGASSLTLEVRRRNFGAHRMYEKFGFRPVGVRKGYYVETGEDAIVMWADAIDSDLYAQRMKNLKEEVGAGG